MQVKKLINNYVGKVEGSRSSDELAAALSSIVVVFFMISIIIFIVGFICGHYNGRNLLDRVHLKKYQTLQLISLTKFLSMRILMLNRLRVL